MVLAAVAVLVPKEKGREVGPSSLRGGQEMQTGMDRAWSSFVSWKVSLATAEEKVKVPPAQGRL